MPKDILFSVEKTIDDGFKASALRHPIFAKSGTAEDVESAV